MFWWGLQVFLYGAILGLSKSHRISSIFWSSSIGFQCSEKHRLSVPFETSSSWDQSTSDLLNAFNLHSRCGWCTRWSPPATVHCLATQNQRDYLLNVPEIALNYRKCLEELEFNQYWNLFLGLLPFARRVIQSLTGHCEVPSNFSLNSSMISSPGFPENLLGSFSPGNIRNPGFEHIPAVCHNVITYCALSSSTTQIYVVERWSWFSQINVFHQNFPSRFSCSLFCLPFWYRPHTLIKIVLLLGWQINIPNAFLCMTVHIVGPWRYRFRVLKLNKEGVQGLFW